MSKCKKVHMYVPEVIRVNLSSSFMVRARCKYCQSGPAEYSIENSLKPIKDHYQIRSRFSIAKKFYYKINYDYLLDTNPSSYTNLTLFKHTPSYKGAHTHAFRSMIFDKSECVEKLWCECGLTQWAFNDKGTKYRREISQRKARYRYPHRFDY